MRSLHFLFALTIVAAGASASAADGGSSGDGSASTLGHRAEGNSIDTLLHRYGGRAHRSETAHVGSDSRHGHNGTETETETETESTSTSSTVKPTHMHKSKKPHPTHYRGPEPSTTNNETEAPEPTETDRKTTKQGVVPARSSDHDFSRRMMHQNLKNGIVKKLRARRALEGPPVEKRWIQGPSIIQDSTPTQGLPPPGANIDFFPGSGAAGTPGVAGLIPPSFPPLANPTAALVVPPLNTLPPVPMSQLPAPVASAAAATQDLQLAVASPVSGGTSSPSAAAAIGDALKGMFGGKAKLKRWVWSNTIIQDNSPGVVPIGGNVINLPGYSQSAGTPAGIPNMPTFAPLPPSAVNNFPGLSAPNFGATPSISAPAVTTTVAPAPQVIPTPDAPAPVVDPTTDSPAPPIIIATSTDTPLIQEILVPTTTTMATTTTPVPTLPSQADPRINQGLNGGGDPILTPISLAPSNSIPSVAPLVIPSSSAPTIVPPSSVPIVLPQSAGAVTSSKPKPTTTTTTKKTTTKRVSVARTVTITTKPKTTTTTPAKVAPAAARTQVIAKVVARSEMARRIHELEKRVEEARKEQDEEQAKVAKQDSDELAPLFDAEDDGLEHDELSVPDDVDLSTIEEEDFYEYED